MSETIIRAEIRKGLIGNGIPERDAEMVTDIAFHAVDSAMQAFNRATNPLEGSTWLNAHGIGLQLLEQAARSMHCNLRTESVKLGLLTKEFTA